MTIAIFRLLIQRAVSVTVSCGESQKQPFVFVGKVSDERFSSCFV